jgi:hypothetical protein
VAAAADAGHPLDAYDRRLEQAFWPAHGQAALMARLIYPFAGFWSRVFLEDQDLIVRYLAVAEGRSDYRALVAATRKSLVAGRGLAAFRRTPHPA